MLNEKLAKHPFAKQYRKNLLCIVNRANHHLKKHFNQDHIDQTFSIAAKNLIKLNHKMLKNEGFHLPKKQNEQWQTWLDTFDNQIDYDQKIQRYMELVFTLSANGDLVYALNTHSLTKFLNHNEKIIAGFTKYIEQPEDLNDYDLTENVNELNQYLTKSL